MLSHIEPATQQAIRVLIVEDNDDDAALLVRELSKSRLSIEYQRAQTREEMQAALDNGCDIVISDYTLPRLSAPIALQILKDAKLDIPFIVVSGTIGEESAVGILREGADDFVLKWSMHRLVPAVHRELQQAQVRRDARVAEEALRRSEHDSRALAAIVTCSADAVIGCDRSGVVETWNPAAATLLGYSSAEAVGQHVDFIIPPADRATAARLREGVADTGKPIYEEVLRNTKDGQVIEVTLTLSPVFDSKHEISGFAGTYHDITEKAKSRRAIKALSDTSVLLASTLDLQATLDGITSAAVPAFATMAAVIVTRGGQFETRSLRHSDQAAQRKLEKAALRKEIPLDHVAPAMRAPIAAARTMLLDMRDHDAEELWAEFAYLDVRHALFLPLEARERTLGKLVLCTTGNDVFGAREIEFCEELARRAAIAIDNAHLYAEAQARTREYETLVDHTPDLIIRLNRECRYVFMNAALNTRGCKREYLLGKGLDRAGLSPELLATATNAVRTVFESGTEFTFDHEDRSETPSAWYHTTVVPERDDTGRVEHALFIIRDVSAMKRAEAKLRESEARYRALVENSTAVTYLTTSDMVPQTLYISPQIQKLGYSVEEWTSDPTTWFRVLHPEDRDAAVAEMRESRRTGAPLRMEYRVVCADGSIRWMRDEAEFLRDHDAGTPALQGVMYDITDQKQMEASLREAAFDLHERAKEARCLYAVSRTLAQTDVAEDELFSEIAALLPPGWQAPGITAARICLGDKCYASANYADTAWQQRALIELNGEEIGSVTVCLTHQPDFAPDFLPEEQMLLRAVADQIASTMARRRAQNDLHRSEAHFRSLIENTTDIITLVDRDGVISYESPSVRRVLGYEPDELIGRNAFDLVHPADRAAVIEDFKRGLSSPLHSARAEFRFQKKNGEWVHVEATGTNMLHDPVVAGVVINSRDISRRKQLEEELLQAQKMEAIGRLAGGVAHDFNNILTVIQGNVEFLLSDKALPRHLRDEAEDVRRAAERAGDLTRQLLAFSRRQVLQPKPIDVNAVLADMERMLTRVIGEDIELVTSCGARRSQVIADPAQLQQVLMNLAVNARDAMPRGGRLRIATSNVKLPADEPGLPAGEYVELSVSDSGVGMSPEVVAHIFEPFFTTKDLGKGTGLGLATVYGIVEQSGGAIRVTSEEGSGTTFEILLPSSDTSAHDDESGIEDCPLPQHHEAVVLLVEDEFAVRKLVAGALRRWGYSVIEASNGSDALQILTRETGRIGLVMTDMLLPNVGGRDVALRALELNPATGIVFMTGYTRDIVDERGPLPPGSYFLEKPFTLEQLQSTVTEAFEAQLASS